MESEPWLNYIAGTSLGIGAFLIAMHVFTSAQ